MVTRRIDSCVFCGRIDANKYDEEWLDVVRFAPLNPVTPGHMLFVPMAHVMSAGADPLQAAHAFQFAADYARRRGSLYPDPVRSWVPFNLITSDGQAATQTVTHLHVHYVPRTVGDGLHLPWTGQPPLEDH